MSGATSSSGLGGVNGMARPRTSVAETKADPPSLESLVSELPYLTNKDLREGEHDSQQRLDPANLASRLHHAGPTLKPSSSSSSSSSLPARSPVKVRAGVSAGVGVVGGGSTTAISRPRLRARTLTTHSNPTSFTSSRASQHSPPTKLSTSTNMASTALMPPPLPLPLSSSSAGSSSRHAAGYHAQPSSWRTPPPIQGTSRTSLAPYFEDEEEDNDQGAGAGHPSPSRSQSQSSLRTKRTSSASTSASTSTSPAPSRTKPNRPMSRSISAYPNGGSSTSPSSSTSPFRTYNPETSRPGISGATSAKGSEMPSYRIGLVRRTSTPTIRQAAHTAGPSSPSVLAANYPAVVLPTSGGGGGRAFIGNNQGLDASSSSLGLSFDSLLSPPTSTTGIGVGSKSTPSPKPSISNFRRQMSQAVIPSTLPESPPETPIPSEIPALQLPPPTDFSRSHYSHSNLQTPSGVLTPSANPAELLEDSHVASAGGLFLSGAWYLGQYIGQSIGLLSRDTAASNEQKEGLLHGFGADEAGEEDAYERKRRRWITLGKRPSSDSDDSEKGSVEDELRSEGIQYPPGAPSSSRSKNTPSYFDLSKNSPPASTSYYNNEDKSSGNITLPTPALSAVSLSGGRRRSNSNARHNPGSNNFNFTDLTGKIKNFVTGPSGRSEIGRKHSQSVSSNGNLSSPAQKAISRNRPRSSSAVSAVSNTGATPDSVPMDVALKTLVSELSWTLAGIGIVFVASFTLVALLVTSLPIHSLRALPKKVSDLQALSTEIRNYMEASSSGWWHVIVALLVTGLWKHSWSVPGAVILNILVGSILRPIPAVSLLTVITAFGSLGSYLLSKPLAPLIALVFPKPLALVRSALTTDSDTRSGGRSGVWRRLLIMRAMGVVPWSGMNVACGVVGVSPLTFLLTTAVGSASWSYVTASIGEIIAQLGSPHSGPGGLADATVVSGGQSITSLVRDPVLITKMLFLSAISLIPIFFKSKNNPAATPPATSENGPMTPGHGSYEPILLSPSAAAMTPLAPTPSMYYAYAVVRNVLRKLARLAGSGVRTGLGNAVLDAGEELRNLQSGNNFSGGARASSRAGQ